MSTAVVDKLWQAIRDSKGVPASERAVTSVLGALDGDHEDRQAVVGHITEDFTLTHKVLKLANSSMYAPFGGGCASVSSALEVLGTEALLHLVLGADLISQEELQQNDNLSLTLLASELARNACVERAEDAAIATLVFEIGRLMTHQYLPAEATAIALRVAAGLEPQAASDAVLGLSYQALGLELAARWHLPEALRATLQGKGDHLLSGIARFSSAAAALIHEGKPDAVQVLLAQLELPGIDKSHLGKLIGHKASEALGRGRNHCTEAALGELLQLLLEDKKTSLEALASSLLPGLAERLQTAHCLLFVRTRSGELRVRNGCGKGIDELRSRLKIAAAFKPTAFHAAIQNNIDIAIADVAKLRDANLPDGYRLLLPHVTQFVILPIATQRVSGLLYCDWDNARVLQPAEMEALKKLRNLLLPFFPQ